MKNAIVFAVLLSAVALGAESAAGQAAPPGEAGQVLRLTMKQAVDMAISPNGNARLQLARELIQQSNTRVAQARSALLPNVDASIIGQNFTRNLRAFGVQAPPPLVFPDIVGPISTMDARAAASQSVIDLSAIKRLSASKAGVDVAKAEEEVARDGVLDQVARAYLLLMREESAVEAASANVALAESLLKLASSLKDAGTGTGIEVTRARVQLANENQRLLVARSNRDRASVQLMRVIGVPSILEARVEPADRLAYQMSEPVTAAEALRTAKDMRADVKLQKRRQRVSQLNYDAVRLERLPSIGAFADAGGIGLEPSDLRFTRTVGLSLRLPVFDGGRRDARRAESASSLRLEQIRERDLNLQVEADIRIALQSLESAEGQVKAAQEGLDLAENEAAQSQRRYEAGVGQNIEVTDAQTRLARARDNRTAALFLHELSRIDLATAMGVIQRVIR